MATGFGSVRPLVMLVRAVSGSGAWDGVEEVLTGVSSRLRGEQKIELTCSELFSMSFAGSKGKQQLKRDVDSRSFVLLLNGDETNAVEQKQLLMQEPMTNIETAKQRNFR